MLDLRHYPSRSRSSRESVGGVLCAAAFSENQDSHSGNDVQYRRPHARDDDDNQNVRGIHTGVVEDSLHHPFPRTKSGWRHDRNQASEK
jgi:hypothetical protein